MSRGIDYGRGQTNIDKANGIRYGVIPMHDLNEFAWEAFEADYGSPCCPKCGNEAVSGDSEVPAENRDREWLASENYPEIADMTDEEIAELSRDDLNYEVLHHACGDYACDSCKVLFDGEDAFGEEAIGHTLDDGEYTASVDSYNDVFILKSPYYTRAQFCSPCAPGACHLNNPCEDGEKAYCFGHDWFEDGKAPYPVYSVATGELVNPE